MKLNIFAFLTLFIDTIFCVYIFIDNCIDIIYDMVYNIIYSPKKITSSKVNLSETTCNKTNLPKISLNETFSNKTFSNETFSKKSISEKYNINEIIKTNNIQMFILFCENADTKITSQIIIDIIINERFDLVKILQKYHNPENILNIAIMTGNIKLVEKIQIITNQKWSPYSFSYAIASSNVTGNLEMLKYLKNNNCLWGIILHEHKKLLNKNSIVIEWLKNNNCPYV